MKRIISIIPVFFIAACVFSASAAEQIDRQQAQDRNLELIGTITTTSTSAPMDAKADLSKKADEIGGKYYVIIAANERDRAVASAKVYK